MNDKSMSWEEFQQADPAELVAQSGALPDADSNGTKSGATPRRIQLKAGTLVTRLIEADPTLDEVLALRVLEQILNESRTEPQQPPMTLRNANQFVPASLADAVDVYIAGLSAEGLAVLGEPTQESDQGTSESSDVPPPFYGDVPTQDFQVPNEDSDYDEPIYIVELLGDEPLSLDELIAQAKQRLLPVANQAYEFLRNKQEREANVAAGKLAEMLRYFATVIYRTAGWDDERIEAQLYKGKDGEIVTDPKQMRFAWFQRTAHAMFRQETKTPEQFLAEFKFPGLSQHKPTPTQQPDNQELPSDEDLADVVSETAWADEVESVVIEPGPIVVDKVDGRRRVSSGDLPPHPRHIVSGGGSKPSTGRSVRERLDALRDSLTATVDDAAADDSDVETPARDELPSGGTIGGRERSDESILANLPDEVVRAAINAVLADSDPEQCWAYRSPLAVREEADRRLLAEYRQLSAA
jgi:hypothetical protein